LTKKSGICLDLAALVVALLRIMGIPAKLTIGMADRQYHAWV
jgi:transglutaminase-like putative cysteine protease